jgi:hypothetical protein
MDEATAKQHIHQHAEAVQRGDFEAVLADFTEELRAQAPQLVQTLPQPVTSATVLDIELGEQESVALIHYAGQTSGVTIRSRWRDVGGRPTIVDAEPID